VGWLQRRLLFSFKGGCKEMESYPGQRERLVGTRRGEFFVLHVIVSCIAVCMYFSLMWDSLRPGIHLGA
jgi:hypothetical protein